MKININEKILLIAGIVLALALAIIITVFAVLKERSFLKSDIDLYFLNESESTLVSEKHTIKYHNENDIEAAVVEEIIKGPDNGKNKPVLNKKTRLNAIDNTDSANITVDFNYRFKTGDTAKDVLTTYAVSKTLCGLDRVERVKITVDRNDVPTAEGKPIGFLSNSDINLSTDTNTSETREVTLYFVDKSTNKLVAEKRNIKVNDQLPLAQYIINELIKGTEVDAHSDVLDKNTILAGVNITDSICFVNFEKSFINKNSGSENKENLAVYSIVNSLTELDNIARVQFLIDGKIEPHFDKIQLDGLFERNTQICN